MIELLASYEETVGAITDVQWQRKKADESGTFTSSDTGNLVICTKNAVMYDLFQTSYIGFKRNGKSPWYTTIREILLKKFAPKDDEEVFLLAKTAPHILTVPMPIMLLSDDKIEIFRILDGETRGRRWNITEKYE